MTLSTRLLEEEQSVNCSRKRLRLTRAATEPLPNAPPPGIEHQGKMEGHGQAELLEGEVVDLPEQDPGRRPRRAAEGQTDQRRKPGPDGARRGDLFPCLEES